jgi:SsrA-binding protein
MTKAKGKRSVPAGVGAKVVALNRKARHDYHVLETLTVGMVLTGTEVKSIRAGKVSLAESFVKIDQEEAFLYACQIAHYAQGNIHNHEPTRVRKLLITKKEILRLQSKVKEKGLTLIPLSMFFQNQWVKLEVGLCKGKQDFDKRETQAKRDAGRQIQRALRQDRLT